MSELNRQKPKRGRPAGTVPGTRVDVLTRMRLGDVVYFEKTKESQSDASFQQQVACDTSRGVQTHCAEPRKYTTALHTAVGRTGNGTCTVIRVERVL